MNPISLKIIASFSGFRPANRAQTPLSKPEDCNEIFLETEINMKETHSIIKFRAFLDFMECLKLERFLTKSVRTAWATWPLGVKPRLRIPRPKHYVAQER